jgi:hypothetical protein
MNLQPIVDAFQGMIFWIIPIMLGLLALKFLLAPKLRGMEGELLAGRSLNRIFDKVLHDIVITDGRGGLTQLDHVALTDQGLLVVETKNYRGLIFGRERDRTWTQKIGRQTHRFQNPLRQNYAHLKALEALELGIPVFGQVVFTNDAQFPKGMPDGVSDLRSLRADVGRRHGDAISRDVLLDGWETLESHAMTDKEARRAHRGVLAERHGKDRKTQLAWGMLGVSVVWLVILWVLGVPTPFSIPSVAYQQAEVSTLHGDMRYATKMAERIYDVPECAGFRERILTRGKGAPYKAKANQEIITTLGEAEKAGCKKSG